MSFIKRIENGRASYAFDAVTDVKTKEFSKEYKSIVRKFPMLIKNNGLANALAFILAKKNGKGKEAQAYENLEKQLCSFFLGKDIFLKSKNMKECKSLAEVLDEVLKFDASDTALYMLLTKDMLNLVLWFKRFAEGLIEDKKKNQNEG